MLSLSLFILLACVPLVMGVGYALLYSLGVVGLIGEGFTFIYWERVLADGEIWTSLAFSFYLAAASMLLALGLSLALVLKLRERLQGGWASYLLYFPLALPAMVAGFFAFQMLGNGGFLARIAAQLGLLTEPGQFPGLINDSWGIGIIFAHVIMAVPFLSLLLLQTWESERLGELRQLATTLGARPWQFSRRVAIPVLLRGTFPSLVLYFIFVLGSYEIPLLLGREDPQMVSVLIIRKLRRFDLQDKPEAYFLALLYTLLVITVVILFLRNPNRRR